MNDEQMQSLLEEEFRALDTTPEDVESSTRRVMERKAHVRQRSRWWPWPVFYREHDTPTASDLADYQSSPIPASNGHTPTVIGRTQSMLSPVKAITAGAIVFAIGSSFLIAQPFQQQGSVPGAAIPDLPAATVSGEMGETQPSEDVEGEVIDGLLQDPSSSVGRLETTDDRLTGDYTEEGTMNRYDPRMPFREGVAEVWSGTIRVENDGGAWDGTRRGCSSCGNAAGGTETFYVELVGSGGYEGLSALLFVEFPPRGLAQVNGVIVPGDLPSS